MKNKKQDISEIIQQSVAEAIAPITKQLEVLQSDVDDIKGKVSNVSETVIRIEGERIGRERLLKQLFQFGGWIVAVGILLVHTLNYQGCFAQNAQHSHPIHQSVTETPAPPVTQK